jgi:radical SAM superfamily enzyme YgiQ (UPF0313 family)
MKIVLVHPNSDDGYKGREADHIKSVPIGLELLAAALENQGDITIIDGNAVDPFAEIDKISEMDWFGATSLYSNHRNCLNLAQIAKSKGAKTVLGGPNVNFLWDRILRNNPFVDYVVVGDGEDALPELVKGTPSEIIPNLAHRKKGEPEKNRGINTDLDLLFNLEHVLADKYDRQAHIPISDIRGCSKAELKGRCSYCSIDHSLAVMDPELVWKQVDLLYSDYEFDFFFHTGDCFFVGDYPEKLLDARPQNLVNTKHKIYVRPKDITKDSLELMQQLNVTWAFLGVETINDRLLKIANRQTNREEIDQALSIICPTDITVQLPFIYGMRGDTTQTIQENFEYAQQLADKHPNVIFLGSKAVPVAGSKWFSNLLNNPEVVKEYPEIIHKDVLDYTKLLKLHLKYSTHTNYDAVSYYASKTVGLREGNAGFGDL